MATDPKPNAKNPRFYNGESVYHYNDNDDRRRAKIKKTMQDKAGNFYYDIQIDDTGEAVKAVPALKLKRIKQKAAQQMKPPDVDVKEQTSTSDAKPSSGHAPRKIALDNDECLGGFRLLSVLYQIHRYHRQYNKNNRFGDSSREKFMESVCEYYLARRGTRPHLARLFRTIMQLKLMKKVDEVYMYTSAENVDGWVEFLKDSLEHFANTPGLYDERFSKKTLERVMAPCGATKKDLLNVATNSKKIKFGPNKDDHMTRDILMFDDKPHNVNARDGTVIGVYAYYDWPNWEDIINLVKANPGMTEFAKWAWQGWDKFERELYKHFDPKKERQDLTQDNQVDLMIRQIRVLYDVPDFSDGDGRRHTERLHAPPIISDLTLDDDKPAPADGSGRPLGSLQMKKMTRAQTAPHVYDIPEVTLEGLNNETEFEKKAKVWRSDSIFVQGNPKFKHLDPNDVSPTGHMQPPTTPDIRSGGKQSFGFGDKETGPAESPHGKGDGGTFAV